MNSLINEKFPPIEAYPAYVEVIMRQMVPGPDMPLDWVIFIGTGLIFDGVIEIFVSRYQVYFCALLWALPLYLLAMRLDRKGQRLQALAAFFTGWNGSVLILIMGYAYFVQVTVLFTVVFPLLSPLFPFLTLCAASRMIDAKAPAWMGWLPRMALTQAHRMGVLPSILTPVSFKALPT